MGLLALLRDTILRMDLISCSPTFRVRKEPNYETIFGGLLSLVTMIAAGYFMYLQFVDMFTYQQITYSQGISDDVDSDSSITSIQFAVSIDNVDLTASPKKFIYQLYQNSVVTVNGTPTTSKTEIKLSPCQLSDWENVGDGFSKQFTAFGFEKMLCINSSESYKLSGYIGSSDYHYLTFQIVQCNQTLNPDCDTTPNVNNYMSNFLSNHDYFNVRFFLVDTILTPSDSQAISYILEKNIFMAFTSTIGTVGYINMAEFSIETDDSPYPYVTTTQQTGSYIQGFQTNSVSISSTKYVSIAIYKSTKSMSVSRTIGKFDTVLSYVGGLFGLIFTGVAFFIGSYSQQKYELYVAQSLLRVDEKGKKIGESDFGFLTYLAYCCYDWMQTFGIAPTCLTRLKTIHEVREEACQQLDPIVILRRIKYLQEVSKVLLNEHRELSLYLSQPMTLEQARRLRNTLFFYDKALNEVTANNYSENSVRDEKFSFSNGNAVANIDSICEQKKQLTEEQEEQVLQSLMMQAVNKLERDNSEIGNKIKEKISKRARDWVKDLKAHKDFCSVEQESDVVSPVSPVVHTNIEMGRSSVISLKKEGPKFILKRQKR